jgi:hypothetical protein
VLLDPENLDYWQQPVRAKDLKEATSKCEKLAERQDMTVLIDVTQSTKTRDKNGKVKFLCWFQSELEAEDDDSDQD